MYTRSYMNNGCYEPKDTAIPFALKSNNFHPHMFTVVVPHRRINRDGKNKCMKCLLLGMGKEINLELVEIQGMKT